MYITFIEDIAVRFFERKYPGNPLNQRRVEQTRSTGSIPSWWIDFVNGISHYRLPVYDNDGNLVKLLTGRRDEDGNALNPIDSEEPLAFYRKEGLL